MVIHYFLDNGDLNLVAPLSKHKSVWMDKVDGIFTFPVFGEWMASSNPKSNHFFNCISGRYFVDTLVYLLRHFRSMPLCCFLSIGTHLFNALIFVFNLQSFTPLIINLWGKLIIRQITFVVNKILPVRLILLLKGMVVNFYPMEIRYTLVYVLNSAKSSEHCRSTKT